MLDCQVIALDNYAVFRLGAVTNQLPQGREDASMNLTTTDRVLGVRLGLGDLAEREICHGYGRCCVCSACKDRASTATLADALPAQEAPAQPWDVKPAKSSVA